MGAISPESGCRVGFLRVAVTPVPAPKAAICGSNAKMASRTNPFTFLQQVRTETAKVTWPTRRETVITTIMVFIMVILAALFFFAVDQILGWGVGLLLSLGR